MERRLLFVCAMKIQRAISNEGNDSSSRLHPLRRPHGVVEVPRSGQRRAFAPSRVVRDRTSLRERVLRAGLGNEVYDSVPALLGLWVTP